MTIFDANALVEFMISKKQVDNYVSYVLILVLFWLMPVKAYAGPGVSIALKGGPDAATLAEADRSNKYGFSGGISGYHPWALTEQSSLAGQLDLLYTDRGAEVVFDGDSIGKTRLHYLDVTLSARPEINLGPMSVYLLLGGGLNLLLSASQEDSLGSKQDIIEGLHRVDLELLAGAGVALHLSDKELGPLYLGTVFLEARHDHGLIGIDAVDGGFENRTSSLMLGLSFALSSGRSAPPLRSDPSTPAAAVLVE
jgi:hypothetical protein